MDEFSGAKWFSTALTIPISLSRLFSITPQFFLQLLLSATLLVLIPLSHAVFLKFDTLKIHSKLVILEFHTFFLSHPLTVYCFCRARRGNSEFRQFSLMKWLFETILGTRKGIKTVYVSMYLHKL